MALHTNPKEIRIPLAGGGQAVIPAAPTPDIVPEPKPAPRPVAVTLGDRLAEALAGYSLRHPIEVHQDRAFSDVLLDLARHVDAIEAR